MSLENAIENWILFLFSRFYEAYTAGVWENGRNELKNVEVGLLGQMSCRILLMHNISI